MEDHTKRQGTSGNFEEKLTQEEILLIWRKRKGWNQTEAGKHFKLSPYNYKLLELGKLKNFKMPPIKIDKLESYERCLLYRRRAGQTQREVAVLMGIGHYWLRLQEVGKVSAKKLLAFWEAR